MRKLTLLEAMAGFSSPQDLEDFWEKSQFVVTFLQKIGRRVIQVDYQGLEISLALDSAGESLNMYVDLEEERKNLQPSEELQLLRHLCQDAPPRKEVQEEDAPV